MSGLIPNWNPKYPKVPVGMTGDWLTYPAGVCGWEDVTPFAQDMKVTGMERGRSSKVIVLTGIQDGRKYRMFVSDMVDAMIKHDLNVQNAIIRGTWTACKRGQNYGVKLVEL